MNRSGKTSKAASHGLMPSNGVTYLLKHKLMLARVVWIAIILPMYALFVANIPAYFSALHHLRSPYAYLFTGQLTLDDLHTLQTLGLSLDFYATCMVVVSLLFQVSYASIGTLLFWRKSDDRIALFASFALMMFPFALANFTLQTLPPHWSWLIPTLSAFSNASLMLCAYVFPDGRFVPRWIRWLALVMLGYWFTSAFFHPWILSFYWLAAALFIGLIASTMLVQLYRYHYISTSRQRQQTKWVVFGTSIAIAGNIAARVLFEFVLLPRSRGSSFPGALEITLISLSMLVLPPTIGIAILRSRLWDIDVIINRTLVYGILTTTLALVYVGLVLTLQFFFREIIAQTNDIAIVGSTLTIAALFQPLRRRIQEEIDRRFYRRKYDASRTLAAFSATLRDEVDLNQLSEQLGAVVQETMQPTHISLWIRRTEHERKPPLNRVSL